MGSNENETVLRASMIKLDGWDNPEYPMGTRKTCEVCKRDLSEHWRGRACLSRPNIVDMCSAVSDHSMGIVVIVNGEDVTRRCTAAFQFSNGDVEAYLLKHNEKGEPYAIGNDVARERIVGPGRIERGKGALKRDACRS